MDVILLVVILVSSDVRQVVHLLVEHLVVVLVVEIVRVHALASVILLVLLTVQ